MSTNDDEQKAQKLKQLRERTIELVCEDGAYLQGLSEYFRKDPEVVLSAIANKPWAWEFADDSLKNDRDFAFEAVNLQPHVLMQMDISLRKDTELVSAALAKDGLTLKHASTSVKEDANMVRLAIQQNGLALEFASNDLKADENIVRAAIQSDVRAVEYADYFKFRDNQAFMTEVVQMEGTALGYATDRLRNNRELVLTAIEQNGSAIKMASSALKDDSEIAFAALRDKPNMIRYVGLNLKDNTDFMVSAMELVGDRACDCHYYAGDEVKEDPAFALKVADAYTKYPATDWDREKLSHPICQYVLELDSQGKLDQWPALYSALEKNVAIINTTNDIQAVIASVSLKDEEAEEGFDFASGTDWESELSGFQSDFEAKKAQEQGRDR